MKLKQLSRNATIGLLLSLFALFLSPIFSMAADKSNIKLGVMEGQEATIWKVAVEQAKKVGLNIELVYFSDYTLPNDAVHAGEIDANAFQHTPYLNNQIKQRGYKLSIAGYTFLTPIGIYSHKIKELKELRDGAHIGIPNDPSNGGRALLLLNSLDLIKLKDSHDILASPLDIIENPKNLQIRELDAGMLGRAIDDFDIAIINTNWALISGLNLQTDAIAWEKAENNPYNNIIVVRTIDKDEPWVKKLVSAYNSEAVRAKIKEVFGMAAQTSW
ncbi:metal ABC transporter substrate-binding protein [Bartonella henselae]|uniref:Lipoprotein n=1 Tax=Bartonella henselae TaxID=38323 RepID=X5M8J1_BARHN|nr:MetQ/NlpA family ABC transporter substrate-binding protein [Bartonella henselae]MDM9997156.1 MetQ/NlpA family ABC transporter substrate-binding protein [Bartonella henselae]OLL38375.1 metal ABC transporter substrate-binding protein [Bartonella henselae]OLL46865.1 metal ABC transporter substrate-binding protein [Bartonella henselae]OLL48597.1 metal ABC transporter substrate-binding protein [Bartonella henselae]OLL51115.1 metal ABC transporter substrate-binding protein [Bartonella henselae]